VSSASGGGGADEAVLARAADVLRSRGERLSAPRAAVLRVLAGDTAGAGAGREHLSAEQVVTAVAEQAPGVHRASVYRALDALSRHDLVRHVHMGHGSTAYHLPDGPQDHLHARCRRCGRVVDLPGDLLDGVATRLAAEQGFVLDPGHVALSGTCAACAEGPPDGEDAP
jgi:Fur family transcriptional regulator, ferric uptake regulator